MAKIILAASTRHRNYILKNFSANSDYLCDNSTNFDLPPPYSFQELDILIGLAFTAILVQGTEVASCRAQLDIFLDYRHAHFYLPQKITFAISHILKKGFSAFKFLGYPYYFDDFMGAYYRILNSTNSISSWIKQEMQEILDQVF